MKSTFITVDVDVWPHWLCNDSLSCVCLGTVELVLPVYVEGVMCKGKPMRFVLNSTFPLQSPLGSEVNDLFSLFREVSLYEDILTRVCTLVSATPATCFHVVVSKVNIIVIL